MKSEAEVASCRPAVPFYFLRHPALDAARGLAVLLMVVVHCVDPQEDAAPVGAWEGFWYALGIWAAGKGAATFCVLAGITWSLQAQRARARNHSLASYYFKRADALLVLGLIFAVTLWPGQILTYFTLYMFCCWPLLHASRKLLSVTLVTLLFLSLLFQFLWEDYVEGDWDKSTMTHLHAWDFGGGTLRYLFFDGMHPVVPWLVYPIVGIWAGRVDWTSKGTTIKIFRRSLLAYLMMQIYGLIAWGLEEELGEWASFLTVSWFPPSIPLILLGTSFSLTVISGMFLLQKSAATEAEAVMDALLRPLVPVGRTALTHYLLHVPLAVYPMYIFGDEESGAPLWTRGWIAPAYFLFAYLSSSWVLRRYRQGPFEWILRRVSGRV